MSTLRSQLAQVITEVGFSKWGVADISGLHPLSDGYPTAVSIGLSYEIPFESYHEPSYLGLTVRVREAFDGKFARVLDFLKQTGIRHVVPGVAPHDPANGVPVYPHKLSAARAGLGWIGKSTLLVTPEFGPRLRLATILLADQLEADLPVTESRCGACDKCSVACPNEAIYDVLWQPNAGSKQPFSAANCGKREEYIATLGRKHACGHCLLVCPVGGLGNYRPASP